MAYRGKGDCDSFTEKCTQFGQGYPTTVWESEILTSLELAPFGNGREALVRGTRTACGRCQMLPHLLVVGAENSGDPDPDGSGKEQSREQGGGGGGQIGEEIGPPPLPPVSF